MKIRLKVCTAILLALLAASHPAAAQFMPEGILRWGGNSEGGVPFIFYDPADPERLTGFETEIAEALTKAMGLKPRFVQNVWDILIPGMKRGLYDMAVNGIEVTPERREAVDFSIPYYLPAARRPQGEPRRHHRP